MYVLGQTSHKMLVFLQNWDWLGRKWQGWTRNLSLIVSPVFMYLSDEVIMTFYWYPYNQRPYTVVFLDNTSTTILSYAPKYGLAV